MPKRINKRINKTKPELLSDMKQVQTANHLREMMMSTIYPILLELNETIGFTKVFLQTAAMTAEAESTRMVSEMKVRDIIEKLNTLFTSKDPKTEGQYFYYRKLFEAMKDESLKDFVSLIEMTPRYIEKYFTQEVDKRPIMELDIKKILG